MKTNSRSKSSLFLMELIIVIMFFALSAAICMKVFSSAKVKTDLARNMTNASFAAESLAECYKAEKLDGTDLSKVYPYATDYNDVYTVYYDADWTMAKEFEGEYRATLVEHEEEYYTQAKIVVYDKSGAELFSMDCAVCPEKGVD
ncbi:MAG: hypothetical protein KBS43_05785 [Oscillospiraceae bacterium]|nr:hypothetical protein [Candidatus Limimonas coprohippi]MCQ2488058.1 hypothetical protein [Clostridia bacterium]